LGLAQTDFLRNSGDKAIIFRSAGQDYHEPIFGDHVFADILAVIAQSAAQSQNGDTLFLKLIQEEVIFII